MGWGWSYQISNGCVHSEWTLSSGISQTMWFKFKVRKFDRYTSTSCGLYTMALVTAINCSERSSSSFMRSLGLTYISPWILFVEVCIVTITGFFEMTLVNILPFSSNWVSIINGPIL